MAKQIDREEERDIDMRVTFSTYGTDEQRIKTAANVKRILEVHFGREIEVAVKKGRRRYQEVERMDRNAAVE